MATEGVVCPCCGATMKSEENERVGAGKKILRCPSCGTSEVRLVP